MAMSERFIGLDIGAETVKVVEVLRDGTTLRWGRRRLVEHAKDPAGVVPELLRELDFERATGAAVSGRLARLFNLPRIPEKEARAAGFRLLRDDEPVTLVSIGSHGFSVLELRERDVEVFRENSRCSQGTGNFLHQLVERLHLSVEEASALCADVPDPAPLSGRCPVILKTDMTHLANVGHSHARIIAGLYDAVCENVLVLVKPRLAPPRVALVGGVSRAARIRNNFRGHLERQGMSFLELSEDEALFMDAAGCAVLAARAEDQVVPALEALLTGIEHQKLALVPPPASALGRVRRLVAPPLPKPEARPETVAAGLIVGLDIGSTGSKAVALDALDGTLVWQSYCQTGGDPVGASQRLLRTLVDSPWGGHRVRAIGVTGSGREIVGSLLLTCYGPERVFVLNEIAAHAEGAASYEPRVDTIFEIGGQDAKYIRLNGGRVIDAAMNEACSAGTGSFIEEQGRRFSGVRDVAHLGEIARGADAAVSLGQHCSVFMAEIIDEATAVGLPQPQIVAGIYDSIIQNYLNRVKGSRSVGDVIFCQGMPFAADALAAAVARQTGAEVIIPPHPGTIGAHGIALLTKRERPEAVTAQNGSPGLSLARVLDARVEQKDQFICNSTKGCGGAGNKCRIDRLRTNVDGVQQRFTWGGGCSLFDRGTGRVKLPDGAADPFREREELLDRVLAALPQPAVDAPSVAVTDEFVLKTLFPFFATFLAELGVRVEVLRGADQKTLKRGIEEGNVPFCAPMQLYHGVVSQLASREHDFLFLPMLISTTPVKGERSVLCPMVEASADLDRWDLAARPAGKRTKVLSPVLDIRGEGLHSQPFVDGLATLAAELGVTDETRRRAAFRRAVAAQERFERDCFDIGRRALDFAEQNGIVPIVVLGRAYTIYNTVLNSNVPAILREQGAIAIPVDCYPVGDDVPMFEHMFWGYGQRNLRAAHQIRRASGIYAVWCSNYACGPDSFTLHFYDYLMDGKPHAVIETDGHSGDAGTRTRIEAFLHCVREDLRGVAAGSAVAAAVAPLRDLRKIDLDTTTLDEIRARGDRILIPNMGPGVQAAAAILRGCGIPTEVLPPHDTEALEIGRRNTSGKECVPMIITLGSLLARLDRETDPSTTFAFLMPAGRGPCRMGVYNTLDKIVLERLGWADRVRVWSPKDDNYFEGLPAGITALVFSAIMAADLLLAGLYDVRPAETRPGAALEIYERYAKELEELMFRMGQSDLSVKRALAEAAGGTLFGCADLIERAGRDFAAARRPGELPTVAVVGEIFVRCDPFSNDHAIDRLQEHGIRVRLAPFNEWLDYQEFINTKVGVPHTLASWVSAKVQARIQHRAHSIMAKALDWPPLVRASQSVEAANAYLRYPLEGEAVLTLGGPLYEWAAGQIDAVLSVGPLECMPNKIVEAQFVHVAEREKLLSLTLALNGDPVDPQVLDNFVFEVRERFRQREARPARAHDTPPLWQRAKSLAGEIGRGFPRHVLPIVGQPWRAADWTYATPPAPAPLGHGPTAAGAASSRVASDATRAHAAPGSGDLANASDAARAERAAGLTPPAEG
jgi:predicted CoA-substrate-specific enzyme activase